MYKREFGESVEGWECPPLPSDLTLEGRYVHLEKLNAEKHAPDLFASNQEDSSASIWDYLPYGPFPSYLDYQNWLQTIATQKDPFFYAIKSLRTNRYQGVASFLRIHPQDGSIEVGHINFSPALQKTIAATEALFLMMKWAFENGYRRYEWKCDAKNLSSRRSAQRLGLSYEGVFRQATVYKNRNRDTAWFAAIDKEWPLLKKAFETWLDDDNFDDNGNQKQSLSKLTQDLLFANDSLIKNCLQR